MLQHISLLLSYRCMVLPPTLPLRLQPVDRRQQVSAALLNDSLAVFPVAPESVTNIQGPVLDLRKVRRSSWMLPKSPCNPASQHERLLAVSNS